MPPDLPLQAQAQTGAEAAPPESDGPVKRPPPPRPVRCTAGAVRDRYLADSQTK